MKVNGTLMNYYIHCPRQCYLFGNRINLEDNSETVNIGKILHEERADNENTEIALDNIKLDKLTKEYLTEIKKSDADIEACKWQLLLYLKILEFIEKKKTIKKTMILELTPEIEIMLKKYVKAIDELLKCDEVPPVLGKSSCKKCAYYEYCYI